jgi:HD superfamily phosphohydrolase YqeK
MRATLALTFIILVSFSTSQRLFQSADKNENSNEGFVGLPRERLIINALTAEKYHNEKLNLRRKGGLHDYVTRLSDAEIAAYVHKEQLEHPDLDINAKAAEYGFSAKFELEDLEHMLYRCDRNQLINFALATEQQHRIDTNTTDLLGGLHDYVASLNDDELREIIMKEANEHTEKLGSYHKLEQFSKRVGFVDNFEVEDLNGQLYRKTKAELINLALAAEVVERTHMQSGLLGGLHDYVTSLDKEQLINYIMDRAQKYDEIKSYQKLENFRVAQNLTSDFELLELKHMLYRQNRNDLINMALAAEMEDRKDKEGISGGLYDSAVVRSDEYLMNYILQLAEQHSEMKNIDNLKELAKKYGFVNNFEIEHMENMFYRTDIVTLKKYALASEKLHRNKFGIDVDGGLHDYIDMLDKGQVIDYIIKEVKEHPEIQSLEKIEEYTNFN